MNFRLLGVAVTPHLKIPTPIMFPRHPFCTSYYRGSQKINLKRDIEAWRLPLHEAQGASGLVGNVLETAPQGLRARRVGAGDNRRLPRGFQHQLLTIFLCQLLRSACAWHASGTVGMVCLPGRGMHTTEDVPAPLRTIPLQHARRI